MGQKKDQIVISGTSILRMLNPYEFILSHTEILSPPLVPEIRLYLARAIVPIWEAIECYLQKKDTDPPFWAFCWPGGQALTRYILDNPEIVRGKRVLDFASGCGITAIGAKMAGASLVFANDIDAMVIESIKLNCALNNIKVEVICYDLLEQRKEDQFPTEYPWDMVLAGDVCYQKKMANKVLKWLRTLAQKGITVLLGDPGRSYMPHEGILERKQYNIPTSLELENIPFRQTGVWQLV